MKKQDSGAEINIRKVNFKWQKPELINLARARTRTRVFCIELNGNHSACLSTGSGADECGPFGSIANDWCTGGSGYI